MNNLKSLKSILPGLGLAAFAIPLGAPLPFAQRNPIDRPPLRKPMLEADKCDFPQTHASCL